MSSVIRSEPSSRGESSPVTPVGSYARLVFQGPDGQTVEKNVLRYTTLIGAGAACNIQLLDPAISAAHCIVTLEAGRLCARDLRSQHGTRLNDSPIQATVLADGDRLQVGSFTFRVETNLTGEATANGIDHVPTHTEDGADVIAQLVFSGPGDERLTKNLLRPTTTIGASRGCNVQLVSNEIAPVHCVVTLEAGYLRLRDLRSPTGSRVNGVSVEVAALSNGDLLELGTFRFNVETNLPSRPLQTVDICRSEPSEEITTDFTHELQELREERATLQAEQVQLQAEQAHLHARLEQLEQDRKQLQQDRESAAEQAKQQDRERDELTARQAELQTQREEYLKDVDNHDTAASELQAAQQRLDADLADLIAEQEALGRSQQEQAQREIALNAERETIAGDRAALEDRSAKLAAEQQELQQQRAQLELDRTALSEEHDLHEAAVQGHRDEVAAFEQDCLQQETQRELDAAAQEAQEKLHQERSTDLQRQSEELSEQREQLQQQSGELAAQQEQLDLQAADHEAEQAEFNEQREEFERQCAEFANEREQFDTRLSDLQQQEQTTREREAALNVSESSLREQREQFQQTRDELNREKAEFATQSKQLAADQLQLDKEQAEQETSRAALEKQRETLLQSQAELDKLRDQLIHDQQQLDESRQQHQTACDEFSQQLEASHRVREAAEQTAGESDEQLRQLQESRRKLEQDRDALRDEQQRVQRAAAAHSASERELQQLRERLAEDESQLQTERQQFVSAQKGFRLEVAAFEADWEQFCESQKAAALEKDATKREQEALQHLRETYEKQQAELEARQAEIQAESEQLASTRQEIERDRALLAEQNEQLAAEQAKSVTEQSNLNELRDTLSREREDLSVEQQRLTEQKQETTASAEELADGLQELQRDQNALHKEREQFQRRATASATSGNGNGSAVETAENEVVAAVTSRSLAGGGIGRAQIEWLLEGRRYRGFFIDRFRIVELLGTGSTGWLYEAEDTSNGQTVALKVLSAQHVINPAMRKRFELEARSCLGLDHPNIIRTLSLEQCDETQFLVMEVTYGASLQEFVELKGPIPFAKACDLVMQAAQGLEQIHDSGVVHRDIKPANVLLTHDGQLKIIDFGLALICGDADELMLKNDFGHDCMGTADYMPPEQAKDSYGVGPTADIYSLGCTLYFALTGKLPFPIEPVAAKLKAHRDRQPTPLSKLNSNVPSAVSEVVERMMAKDRADRFQTAADVVEALRPLAQRSPIYFDFQAILQDRAVTAKKRMFLLANWEMNRPISPAVVDRKTDKRSPQTKQPQPELTRP